MQVIQIKSLIFSSRSIQDLWVPWHVKTEVKLGQLCTYVAESNAVEITRALNLVLNRLGFGDRVH